MEDVLHQMIGGKHPIIHGVSTIRLVMQDFAGPSTALLDGIGNCRDEIVVGQSMSKHRFGSRLGIAYENHQPVNRRVFATLVILSSLADHFPLIPSPVHTKNTPVQRNHGFLSGFSTFHRDHFLVVFSMNGGWD